MFKREHRVARRKGTLMVEIFLCIAAIIAASAKLVSNYYRGRALLTWAERGLISVKRLEKSPRVYCRNRVEPLWISGISGIARSERLSVVLDVE